jgi:hypothetical protein
MRLIGLTVILALSHLAAFIVRAEQAGNVWHVRVLSKGLPSQAGVGDRRLAADLRSLSWLSLRREIPESLERRTS